MNDSRRIGERIREARQSARLTQGQLAEKIGVWPATLSDWERGGVDVKVAGLLKIAAALEIPLDQLVDASCRRREGG